MTVLAAGEPLLALRPTDGGYRAFLAGAETNVAVGLRRLRWTSP